MKQLPGDDSRYGRAYGNEQSTGNQQAQHLFQDRPHNYLNRNEPERAGIMHGSNERHNARQHGSLTYGQDRSYGTPAGVNRKKAGNRTGANIYIGGKTSSFGPSGCKAVQKQYNFGKYSTRQQDTTGAVNKDMANSQ